LRKGQLPVQKMKKTSENSSRLFIIGTISAFPHPKLDIIANFPQKTYKQTVIIRKITRKGYKKERIDIHLKYPDVSG